MVGIVVLMTFGAVFVLTLVMMSVVATALAFYQDRYASRGARQLSEMFFFIDPRQLAVLSICAALLFGVVGFVASNWLVGLCGAVGGFLTPWWGIGYLRRKRIREFERQLVDALLQMSSGLKAGLSLAQTAEATAREMPPPLGQEFGLLVKELKLGVAMEEALGNLAGRVQSEDLHLVVASTNVARQLGGNMAEMFEIISATIRERFRLEGRIRALTAQGKLQGWIVGFLPVLLALALNFLRPDLMGPMLASGFGVMLVATVAVMEVIGIWLIRRIVAIDV